MIMYADSVTGSMERAIRETERRRLIQMKYNEEHGIVPKTIKKDVRDVIEISKKEDDIRNLRTKHMKKAEKEALIKQLTAEMKAAAKLLQFEQAAYLRDKIEKLRELK